MSDKGVLTAKGNALFWGNSEWAIIIKISDHCCTYEADIVFKSTTLQQFIF